jgi:uncharacterized protein
MFLRILLWLLLLIAAWWIFRPRAKLPPASHSARAAAAGAPAPAETMVDCAHCGLHLPSSEALRDDAARAYCSNAHRSAGPRSDR